jgi:hypothetical protein
MKRLVLIVLALCALPAAAGRADDLYRGYYGYGFPWFGYGNNGPAAYALGNIPTPPYFALHPPVYYSHPIARPYGHSPFACPCYCGHARKSVRVVVNPYLPIEPAAKEAPAKASVAAVPLRVANPFYRADSPAQTDLVQRND